jgi:hypothetical protein
MGVRPAGWLLHAHPPAKRSLPRDWLPLAGAVLAELGRLQAALGAMLTEKNPFCLGRGCPGTGLKKKN